MRPTVRDVAAAIGLVPNRLPRNVKFDYGQTPSTSGQNTVINFNTPFGGQPTVTFGNAVAWNTDPAIRLVGLTPSQCTIVVATSGVVHWMAIGPA